MQGNFLSAIVKIWQNFQTFQVNKRSKSLSADARALRRLSRRIARLAQETKTQIDTVDQRVKDLDTEKLAWMQDKFDANAYRKSLESNVYGHVLQRVQTLLGVVTILGGAAIYTGLEIRLGNQLETEVDTVVEKTISEEFDQRIAGLIQDLEEGRRDNLLSLLQQAAVPGDGGSFARARIEQYKQDEAYQKLLQGFISDPDIPEEQEIAVQYLQTTQDADLQTALIEAFRNRNTDPEIRSQMFQALLQYSKDTKLRALEVIRQEATTESSLWQDAIKTLATERINSPIAGDIMRIALQDDEPDMSRWAATFFILNSSQWKESDTNIVIKDDLLTSAVLQTLVEANKADELKNEQDLPNSAVELSPAQQNRVIDTLTNLADKTNNSDLAQNQVWQTQFEAIRRSLALTLLHAGSPNLFEEVSNNNGYYAYDVWLAEVLPWFNNFKLENSNNPLAAATEEEQQSNQYQLLSQLGNSYWNPAIRKYQIFDPARLEPTSIERLKQGDVSLFLRLMATTYYSSADLWRSQVLPLFPDAVKPEQNLFAAPTGTNEEQDALWNWVQAQQDQLVWNAQSQKYELKPAPAASGSGR